MKTFLCLLLCASLVANATLLVRGRNHPPQVSTAAATPVLSTPKKEEPHPITEQVWGKAITGDKDALQVISDSGLPPELRRAMMRAAVNERFAERERALYKSAAELKYWEINYDRARYTPVDRTALLDLRREKEGVLDQVTPGWREEDEAVDPNRSFLTAEKSHRLNVIEEDYNAMIANVRGEFAFGGSVSMPADREKLKYLEQERRTELAQILTPQELGEYDLRRSSAASMMRYQLSAFEPTEQEFRNILPIQKGMVDDKYSFSFGPMTADDRAARTKAQEQADAQIKTLLGEQRYADYTRSKDYEYRTLSEITDHYQLPKDRAIEAYNLKGTLEQKFQAATKESSPEARAQMATAVRDEADREFTRLLGAKGYAVYKQNSSLAQRLELILATPPAPKPKPKE